jgi:hypothetical protein
VSTGLIATLQKLSIQTTNRSDWPYRHRRKARKKIPLSSPFGKGGKEGDLIPLSSASCSEKKDLEFVEAAYLPPRCLAKNPNVRGHEALAACSR